MRFSKHPFNRWAPNLPFLRRPMWRVRAFLSAFLIALVATGHAADVAKKNGNVGQSSGAGTSKSGLAKAKAQHHSEHVQQIVTDHQARIDALKAKRKEAHAKKAQNLSTQSVSPGSSETEAQRKARLKAEHDQHKADRKDRFSLDAQLRADLNAAAKTDIGAQEEVENEEKE